MLKFQLWLFFFKPTLKNAWIFIKPLKTPKLPELFICSMACTWLYWPLAGRCLQRCPVCLLKNVSLTSYTQPSGNNITHTERSWCQGQLSCKRWGRCETCIDFSFCWGKQACCGWARVQWGRQNVLDCLFQLVTRELWLPERHLGNNYHKKLWNTIDMCFLKISINIQDSGNARGNNPSDYIIQSKESWWRKFGCGSREETQPASPQKGMRQSWQSLTTLGLAGWKCLSNTLHDATGHRSIPAVQPLPNSYKLWMNAKSYNLCEPLLGVLSSNHLK